MEAKVAIGQKWCQHAGVPTGRRPGSAPEETDSPENLSRPRADDTLRAHECLRLSFVLCEVDMERPTKWLLVAGMAGVMSLSATTVAAQNVQTFDGEVDGDGDQNVALPGAPAPEQQQSEEPAPRQQQADDEQEGQQQGVHGSYQINIHGADPGGQADRPGRADTQTLLSDDDTEVYQGVIPGERDEVGHIPSDIDEGEPNRLTWVGFRPEDDKTRVFFQAPSPVEYQVREQFDDNELIVVFDHAEIGDRNFSRFIDASHFDRAVERIEARETDDGDVEVTLTMNEDVEPATQIDGEYLYLDFPYEQETVDEAQADAE